ncbi:hypothetical protein IFR05_006771 [Cadophora sp. M221]|nr:hypothetical protein IFR05_006771 [Cadophora sp. M221]
MNLTALQKVLAKHQFITSDNLYEALEIGSKCDETQPECKQCSKAGWVCPRYGDIPERLFQNRTLADFTIDPSPKELSSDTNQVLSISESRGTSALQRDMCRERNLGPPPHIIQPVTDQAINLFLASHVPNDTVFIRGCFEYLPEFRRTNGQNAGFSASLNAAALAAYGNTVQSTMILTQARKHLGTALRFINTALMSPEEAIKDSTVISIMLLATFETITCRDQKSLGDCDMHTKGAATIIELRGKGQFQSLLGLQLFVQMCGDISRGCLQRSVRVPTGVIAARSHAATLLGQQDSSWQLSEIIIQVAEFRAGVKDCTLSEANDIIATALELDASLSTLVSTVPTGHRFKIVQPENDTDLIYGGYYHIYPSFWAAYFWNNVRTCRILLHQEILRQTDATSYATMHSNPQAGRSNDIIGQMGLDICATIPQYTGYLPLLANQSEVQRVNATRRSHPKLLPGTSVHAHAVYSLFWPLLIVGQASKSGKHRQWLVDRAREIGRISGIHQAFALADVLERHEKIGIWED